MIYYFFLAIIDIGWYLWDNKLNLTFTLVASGVGVILGKRLGTRIAINYIMRTLGLEQKSTIERQVMWLIELEKGRGNVWNVSMLPSEEKGLVDRLRLITKRRLKYLHKVGLLARCVGFIIRPHQIYQSLRRMNMKNFLTGKKKWLAFLIAVAVNGLDSTLGLGLGAETVNNITQGATGYIVIEGVLDFTRALTDYLKSKGAKHNAELNIPIEPPL